MPTITPEQWRQIERAVDAALTLAPADRAAYLDAACGDDRWMRKAVDHWLDGCADAAEFLSQPPTPARPLLERVEGILDGAEKADARIGPYRLIREIARGGMGVVFLAERADGQFEQRVALKLIDRAAGSDEIHRRFLAERQILASLNHPNIARLIDGGVTPDGRPWFAMEYVEGSTITQHCDDRRLTTDARLALFLDVCAAVSDAHRNLIVHRDLKPSNVLVTADGTVKLLDFGIAKLLLPADSPAAALTAAEDRLLTPEYASPEQVLGLPITTATDVYALGAVLYELLTGQRAHRVEQRSMAEVIRVVIEVDPVPPQRGGHGTGVGRSARRRHRSDRRHGCQLHPEYHSTTVAARAPRRPRCDRPQGAPERQRAALPLRRRDGGGAAPPTGWAPRLRGQRRAELSPREVPSAPPRRGDLGRGRAPVARGRSRRHHVAGAAGGARSDDRARGHRFRPRHLQGVRPQRVAWP